MTPKPKPADASAQRDQAIRQRAYELWEKAGRPVGRALEYWLLAEQELKPSETAKPKGKSR
jgi:hypothetical protein